MIPDRKEYKVGDTAQILVQAPFYPAEAVMSLRRSGIVRTEAFRMDAPTYILRVPVEESWTPNVHVQVDLVGSEDRSEPHAVADGPVRAGASTTNRLEPGLVPAGGTSAASKREQKRPAYASGEINLSIPPLSRKLNIVATPRDKTLEPGGSSVVDVEAKEASGKPVSGGEVAVVVVDESVLALVNYKLDDPVSIFYAERPTDTTDFHLRGKLRLAIDGANESGGLGGAGGGAMMETVSVTADSSNVDITRLPINGRRALSNLRSLRRGRLTW